LRKPVKKWLLPALSIAGILIVLWALDYLFARPIPDIDVSNEEVYANLLGTQFRTQHELIAIGVTLDRNYKKQIDYIKLVMPPGFSGPEVVEKGVLPKGSVLKVTAVIKADSWLVNRVKYVVERLDGSQPVKGKMVIDVNEGSNIDYGLPLNIFRVINENS